MATKPTWVGERQSDNTCLNQIAWAGGGGGVSPQMGAANTSIGQVTTSSITASTLVVARPTRRFVTVNNTDAAITVYVGPTTVTAANGYPLKAGQSNTFYGTGLLQVIAASGTPVVAFADYYD